MRVGQSWLQSGTDCVFSRSRTLLAEPRLRISLLALAGKPGGLAISHRFLLDFLLDELKGIWQSWMAAGAYHRWTLGGVVLGAMGLRIPVRIQGIPHPP